MYKKFIFLLSCWRRRGCFITRNKVKQMGKSLSCVFERRLVWSACGGEEKKSCLFQGLCPCYSLQSHWLYWQMFWWLVPCCVWQNLVSVECIGALVNLKQNLCHVCTEMALASVEWKSSHVAKQGKDMMDFKNLKYSQFKIQCVIVTYIHSHDKKDWLLLRVQSAVVRIR